jgi:hypothetical protein
MEFIKNQDLKLTKAGFFRLFNDFRKEGMSIQKAYNKVSSLCDANGYQGHYTSISSLKKAIYTSDKK